MIEIDDKFLRGFDEWIPESDIIHITSSVSIYNFSFKQWFTSDAFAPCSSNAILL